jgi:hypothetical protein
VVAAVSHGLYVIAGAFLASAVTLFWALLPSAHHGWVIYNISPQECRRALQRACRRMGWELACSGPLSDEAEIVIRPANLNLSLSTMPWLRNVTLRCDRAGPAARQLAGALNDELRRESLLPSATGAGLVVIGATLLGLPLWYFFNHMDAIVDVVRRMILA